MPLRFDGDHRRRAFGAVEIEVRLIDRDGAIGVNRQIESRRHRRNSPRRQSSSSELKIDETVVGERAAVHGERRVELQRAVGVERR